MLLSGSSKNERLLEPLSCQRETRTMRTWAHRLRRPAQTPVYNAARMRNSRRRSGCRRRRRRRARASARGAAATPRWSTRSNCPRSSTSNKKPRGRSRPRAAPPPNRPGEASRRGPPHGAAVMMMAATTMSWPGPSKPRWRPARSHGERPASMKKPWRGRWRPPHTRRRRRGADDMAPTLQRRLRAAGCSLGRSSTTSPGPAATWGRRRTRRLSTTRPPRARPAAPRTPTTWRTGGRRQNRRTLRPSTQRRTAPRRLPPRRSRVAAVAAVAAVVAMMMTMVTSRAGQ
mmetsp:Transcript_61905/g.174498  ORF Transcript_61905/g.174498 Transcript_61905/m.174498 type:complete len:287 (-) Transcript_61905:153-1013(-)